MTCPATDIPASCEIRAVIRFLHAKNMSLAEIHNELCAAVYCQSVMTGGNASQWCRMFKDGPPVGSHDFVQSVDQKQCVNEGASQFQNFHVDFHKFQALFFTRLSQLG
jgi:hypothetical protein